MLNVVYGVALIAAFIGLWIVGWYLFTWLLYGFLSLIPYVGKRHKHPRWDELNGINRRSSGNPHTDGARGGHPTTLDAPDAPAEPPVPSA